MSKKIIYTSCDELPLSCFIRCIVENDLQALVKKGSAPIEELAEAWANIYSEYLDLNEDNEAKYILTLQKDINLLRYRLVEVASVVNLLNIIFHPGLVQALRDQGFDEPLDPANELQFKTSLKIIDNSLGSDRLQLEMKETELFDYVRSRGQETIDKNYFHRQLIRISKYMGYTVRAKEVTVMEFIIMIKDMFNTYKSTANTETDGGDQG